MREGDLYVISPEYFDNLYGRVIECVNGTALMYFSDGNVGSEFREPHHLWEKTDKSLAYLAGPMRGIYQYNAFEFDLYEQALQKMGYLVVNPSRVDKDLGFDARSLPEEHDWGSLPFGFSLDRAGVRCSVGVAMSDVLYLMPGWRESKGARAEYSIARWLDKPVYEIISKQTAPDEFEFYERMMLKDEEPETTRGPEPRGIVGAIKLYVASFFKELSK